MKTKNLNNYAIPLVVIVCSAILLVALTVAIGGVRLAKADREIHADFPDITGIHLHTPVMFAGFVAGSVTEIRYLTADERKDHPELNVRLTLSMMEGVPPIPSDVKVGIGSETPLSEKLIMLAGGTPEATPLKDGDVVIGKATSIDTLIETAQDALKSGSDILSSFKSDYPNLIPRITNLLNDADLTVLEVKDVMGKLNHDFDGYSANITSILTQASNLVGNANLTILNLQDVTAQLKADYGTNIMPHLDAILAQVRIVTTNANLTVEKGGATLDSAKDLIQGNSAEIEKLLTELRVVSQNLKVVSTYAKAMTATLGEKPSRIIWGGGKNELPTEEEILNSSEPVILKHDR